MATEVERLLIQLEMRLNAYERESRRARQLTNRTASDIERRFDRMAGDIGRRIKNSLVGPLAGIGAVLGTRELIRYADGWTSIANRLAAVGVASDEVRARQEQLFQVAIRSRTAFDSVAQSYTRLKLASEALGLVDQDLLRITETVSKAMQVGGASASEAASAGLQLAQALGSGVLAGDELRAIRENALVLAKAIAQEFGVTVGELKELGAEGELTSARVAKAILKASGDIDGAFAKTRLTVSQALTNVESAFTRYIGDTDSALGITARLAQGLEALANNMDVVGDATLALAAIVATALLGRALNPLLLGVAALSRGLTAVVAVLFTTSGAARGLAASLIGAQVAGAGLGRGMVALRAAMGFLGPGGLLAVAVTTFLLFVDTQSRSEKAAAANARALDTLRGNVEGLDRKNKDAVASTKALAVAQLALTQVAAELAAAELAAGERLLESTAGFEPARRAVEAKTAELRAVVEEYDRSIAVIEKLIGEIDTPSSGTGTGGGAGVSTSKEAEKAAEKRAEAIEALQREIGLNDQLIRRFGEGAAALERIRAAYEAVNEARKLGFEGEAETRFVVDKLELARQQEMLELLREGAALTEELRTKEEERAATVARLNELRAAGAITEETFRLALEQTSAEYERQQALLAELEDFGERAFDRIGEAVTEAFAKGELAALDFGDITKAVLSEILQEMIRLSVLNPLKNAIFGGSGGSLLPTILDAFGGAAAGAVPGASMAGRGAAMGGPVSAGRRYTVGELGREEFVPAVGGTIIPAQALAAPAPVVVNIVNRAPDTETKTSERNQGGQEQIDVVIDRIMADKLSRPGTASRRALANLGVRAPLARR